MTSETLYLLPDESIVKDLPEGVECYSVLHTTLEAAGRDVYYRLAWLFGSELADQLSLDVFYELYRGIGVRVAEHQGASYYALAPMPTDEFLGYVGRADDHQLLAKELIAKQSISNKAATQEEEKLKRWERSLEDWADELERRERSLEDWADELERRERMLHELADELTRQGGELADKLARKEGELDAREQALALREGKVEARESTLWEALGALRAPYRDQS